nr:hypothetical protein Iba_chr09dCG13610 [Ipomoea batatas]
MSTTTDDDVVSWISSLPSSVTFCSISAAVASTAMDTPWISPLGATTAAVFRSLYIAYRINCAIPHTNPSTYVEIADTNPVEKPDHGAESKEQGQVKGHRSSENADSDDRKDPSYNFHSFVTFGKQWRQEHQERDDVS